MPSAEPSSVAIALLQERSRDALIARLSTALADMGQKETVVFLANLLLAAGADRDHLGNG